MEKIESYVWCDIHGDIHDESTNPYDGPPTLLRDGRPVWLRYPGPDEGDELIEMEPDCTSEHWRVLWAGRKMA